MAMPLQDRSLKDSICGAVGKADPVQASGTAFHGRLKRYLRKLLKRG